MVDPFDVHIDDARPCIRVAVGNAVNRIDQPGVVNQHIKAAEGFGGVAGQGCNRLAVGHVADHGRGLPARVADFLRVAGDCLAGSCGQHHPRTETGKMRCSGRPDAATGACDHHCFVFESVGHCRMPFLNAGRGSRSVLGNNYDGFCVK